MRRSSSRFTSGRSRTPDTTLKIAALAPIPSASVATTVIARPLTLESDRSAKRKSASRLMRTNRSSAAGQIDVRRLHIHAPQPFVVRPAFVAVEGDGLDQIH